MSRAISGSRRWVRGLFRFLLGSLCLMAMGMGCRTVKIPDETNFKNCTSCHTGIEAMGPNHDFPCESCHLSPDDRQRARLVNHRAVIRNPSDPRHVRVFCTPCHVREVDALENGLHGSMAGIINQTRYLWGAQEQSSPAVYGLSGTFLPLPRPDPTVYPEKPADLVDDFLRRRCLRCHIHAPGRGGPGLYRASGCAACHVLYDDDGLYRGNDDAIDRGAPGYPARHTFTSLIPNRQCLHCHNRNAVGADYEGLFEHDYAETYNSPTVEGKPVSARHGVRYHHLARDVHCVGGLWCVDCHSRGDVMGDGRPYSHEGEVPKVGCSTCHGGFRGLLPDLSHPALCVAGKKFVFRGRDGGRHALTLFSDASVGHRVEAHARVRCSTCHAQWSYQDYGLSVIREDRLNGDKWRGLTGQGDPELQGILDARLRRTGIHYPISADRISGDMRAGIWSMGWRFRRWEPMPLGIDAAGRFALLRPRYQYLISYVNRLGDVVLDSVVPSRGDGSGAGWAFSPYTSHTIAPAGRSCDSCHRNPMVLGLGLFPELSQDTRLSLPSPPPVPGMRLLNPNDRARLMHPTTRWGKARLEALLRHPSPRLPRSERREVSKPKQ